ncbi:glycosyltransferase family 4 protein [Domibacillus aminovorans]|uniref:Polysaccharide biosynthesis protein n=1 Tax=Domibacillus aminovorans TaxID=29332 RepID=A0A177L011_9BACI|nr:glycosyltransferase family 4 protein [Domibacillus aminovorans]OAH58968.1 polysaccharide biosynthesis protein [Domibacillus aminovorans]
MASKKILQICAIDLSVDALLKPLILRSMYEGYEVHNACTDTGRFERLRQEGLTMIDIKIDREISPLKNIKSIIHLYKLMKKEKYDIVHVHTPIAALLGRIAAKLAGVENIIYTAHGFYFHDEMSAKQYTLFYNIEKYAAHFMTDWLLLQSKEDYELALKDRFVSEERTIHLSNGVNITNKFNMKLYSSKRLADLRQMLQIEENDFVFAFIGRLVKEKGVFELLEAFSKLAEEQKNVKLLMIGGLLESERDQDSYQKLESYLENDQILPLGFRKDIPDLLAISDTFILPSYREGLPRSIIEAMAMKKPIIATNIRGCREEVFDNINGYLIEKEKVEPLYEAMRKLSIEPQLATKMGIESRRLAEELFDEEKVLEKQQQLFAKLTGMKSELNEKVI